MARTRKTGTNGKVNAPRRKHPMKMLADVGGLLPSEVRDRERLREAAASWHAKVAGIVETLFDAADDLARHLRDNPDGDLAEFLHPANVSRLASELSNASTALYDMIPPAKLDLPDVLLWVK